jgi:hypothetical protein
MAGNWRRRGQSELIWNWSSGRAVDAFISRPIAVWRSSWTKGRRGTPL